MNGADTTYLTEVSRVLAHDQVRVRWPVIPHSSAQVSGHRNAFLPLPAHPNTVTRAKKASGGIGANILTFSDSARLTHVQPHLSSSHNLTI